MRIYIKSNFVVPGLVRGEFLDLDQSQLTLREFLQELSERAPTRVEYVRPGANALDPDEWEVDINGIPYHRCSNSLETPLKDGDTVTIRILALGGG
jgi:molybdopterin converting factor small subunit